MEIKRLIKKIMQGIDEEGHIENASTRIDLVKKTIDVTINAYEEYVLPIVLKKERTKSRSAILNKLKELAAQNTCKCVQKCLREVE